MTCFIMVWAPSVRCLLSIDPCINLYLVNVITFEIISPASPNSLCGFLKGRSWMSLYLGHLDPLFKVTEVNTVYQIVKTITCEITDPASPNSVCGFFQGRWGQHRVSACECDNL